MITRKAWRRRCVRALNELHAARQETKRLQALCEELNEGSAMWLRESLRQARVINAARAVAEQWGPASACGQAVLALLGEGGNRAV